MNNGEEYNWIKILKPPSGRKVWLTSDKRKNAFRGRKTLSVRSRQTSNVLGYFRPATRRLEPRDATQTHSTFNFALTREKREPCN